MPSNPAVQHYVQMWPNLSESARQRFIEQMEPSEIRELYREIGDPQLLAALPESAPAVSGGLLLASSQSMAEVKANANLPWHKHLDPVRARRRRQVEAPPPEPVKVWQRPVEPPTVAVQPFSASWLGCLVYGLLTLAGIVLIVLCAPR